MRPTIWSVCTWVPWVICQPVRVPVAGALMAYLVAVDLGVVGGDELAGVFQIASADAGGEEHEHDDGR